MSEDLMGSQCPTCRAPGIPVIWGKPSASTLRAHDLGLARTGGCIVRGDPTTTWWCPACEESFLGAETSATIESIRDEVR